MKRNGVILLMMGIVFALGVVFLTKPGAKLPASEVTKTDISPLLPQQGALAPLELMAVKLPTLSDLRELGTKVLLNARERDELTEQISSRHNINQAAAALLRVTPKLDKEEERDRMKAVDFLVTAILSPENPDREYAMKMASEVISSENLFETKDLGYRKSLVGDKMELYQAVAKADPAVAAQIYEKAQGSPMAKVMRFVKGSADFKASLTGSRS